MLPSICLCGNDPALLLARTLVLEHAGFRVEAVLGVAGLLERGGERVVLCSSLSEAEQTEAIVSARARFPEGKILAVCSQEGEMDETVLRLPIFSKTEALIQNAGLLLQ